MAFPNADANGVLTGKFTIPAGIPSGTKEIVFTGAGGSKARANFIGEGRTQITTRQVVTTKTTTLSQVVVDPLAQTFTLPAEQFVTAVDLWFTAKGPLPVEVQIRETSNGVPTRAVLTSKRLAAADIAVDGTPTRVTFPEPFPLLGGVEYAIVALTNDDITSVAIAELGKFDALAQRWVTAQPYQIGVLLSSSNAITWTPHQDRDLTFRLITAHFTSTSRTVELGTVEVTGATHIGVRANVHLPRFHVSCRFAITLPDSTVHIVAADQTLRLATPVTGEVSVAALLEGTATITPVLHRDVQLFWGTMATTGDYVSRAFTGGTSIKVKVVIEVKLGGSSTVAAHYKGTADGGWTALNAPISTVSLADGWVELTYESATVTKPMVQAKLALTGDASNQPEVRKFRAVVV